MAIASYPDSINKRLPLHPLDRRGTVAAIPNLFRIPTISRLILRQVILLLYNEKQWDFLPAGKANPWSEQHLSR
jgi:hypothetical protein